MKRLKVEHRAIERMKDQESPRSTSNNGRGEKKSLEEREEKLMRLIIVMRHLGTMSARKNINKINSPGKSKNMS